MSDNNTMGGTRQFRNPWLGLETYTEKKIKEGYKFCGRNDEIDEMVTLVECNLTTVLYGRSGIGKSSLLEAGVFPRLRNNGYSPFWIRIDTKDNSKSYHQQIIDFIEEYNTYKNTNGSPTIDNSTEHCATVDKSIDIRLLTEDDPLKEYDGLDQLYLWHYMHSREFSKSGNPTIPVLVFDQFEEVLLKNKDRAKLLMMQIYQLISSSNILHQDGYNSDDDYRIIISLREDYLYLLEEAIDAYGLAKLQNNRYRLQPLKVDQAKDIILNAGKTNPFDHYLPVANAVDETEGEAIADKIIEHSLQTSDRTISTQIISLICHQLYEKVLANEKRTEKILKLKDVESEKDIESPLTDFYLQKTSCLSAKERKYIENEMVTDDGMRKPVPYEDFKENVPHHEQLFNDHIVHSYRLALNSGDQVEIIHDQIAKVIESVKLEAREKLLKKRLKIAIVLLVILFAAIILGIVIHKRAARPIPFVPEDYIGKAVTWQGRPYEIKNGHLTLIDCIVKPYAFPNGWEIDTLTKIGTKKIYYSYFSDYLAIPLESHAFSQCHLKVLELKGYITLDNTLSYDSTKTIIIGENTTICGTTSSTKSHNLISFPKLEKVYIHDTNYVFKDGTLFYNSPDGIFPLVSRRADVFYDSSSVSIENARPYAVLDIANKKQWSDRNYDYYVLSCSDTNIKTITKDDIPSNGTLVGIDLPAIEYVAESTFHGSPNLSYCQFIYFDNLKEIGHHNKGFGEKYSSLSAIDTLRLPDTVIIHEELFSNMSDNFNENRFSNDVTFLLQHNDESVNIYKWKKGLVKQGEDRNKQQSCNNMASRAIDSAVGYHYYNNKIVFDSDFVIIPSMESNDILYDSLIIPKTIIASNKDGYFTKGNVLYFHEYGTETRLIPATGKTASLYLPPNSAMYKNAYGATTYKIFWPERYNIPAGDTIIVPYGQTEIFKRIYSSGITIREMGFWESIKWKKEVKSFYHKLKIDEYFKTPNYLHSVDPVSITGDSVLRISDADDTQFGKYLNDTAFDRPLIKNVKISLWSPGWTKRGNVIYSGSVPVRSINNGKPTVIKYFRNLNGKKIHQGTFVLFENDALFPEPSLADPAENYTFLVPHGKKNNFALLEEQGATVIEMNIFKTLGLYIIHNEKLDKRHEISDQMTWTWRVDGIPLLVFFFFLITSIVVWTSTSKKKLKNIDISKNKKRKTVLLLLCTNILICLIPFIAFQIIWFGSKEIVVVLFSLPIILILQALLHLITLSILHKKQIKEQKKSQDYEK